MEFPFPHTPHSTFWNPAQGLQVVRFSHHPTLRRLHFTQVSRKTLHWTVAKKLSQDRPEPGSPSSSWTYCWRKPTTYPRNQPYVQPEVKPEVPEDTMTMKRIGSENKYDELRGPTLWSKPKSRPRVSNSNRGDLFVKKILAITTPRKSHTVSFFYCTFGRGLSFQTHPRQIMIPDTTTAGKQDWLSPMAQSNYNKGRDVHHCALWS